MIGPARQADAFYILGDLFDDFWLDCDDKDPPQPEIIDILKNYSDAPNTNLFIMRGNRDFFLDQRFADMTGCLLLEDPHKITLSDRKVLLMHGDTLCTDDKSYQRWRRFITHPATKKTQRLIPCSLRKRIAERVRAYTATTVREKSSAIIDVSQSAVVATMNKHRVHTIIHGHTHRQAMHQFTLNGKPAMRIVLGDWYQRDCVLVQDGQKFRFERVEDYITIMATGSK